jgi:NADPH:quinone reductase
MTDVPARSHAVQIVEGPRGPELIWVERETPKPAPDEALVRVRAAGINPSDVGNLAGAFGTKLPRVPGRDLAGTVVRGPADWLGADVWAVPAGSGFIRDGCHAEYAVVRVESLSKKPEGIGFELAAGAGVPYVTAWEGLVNRARVRTGETVLVVGMGSVGVAVAQIARSKGARVIGASSQRPERLARWQNEVDVAVDSGPSKLADAVRAATGGRGVDVVFNAIGGSTFAPSLEVAAQGGRFVSIAAAPPREVGFDLLSLYRRNLSLLGINTLAISDAESAAILASLGKGFEQGRLRVNVDRTFPLDGAERAYAAVRAGGVGKVVLVAQGA